MIDLHLHSYYSDGVFSPKEIAIKAKQNGLSFVCLTDHNSIDGLEEFAVACHANKLKFISGIEIYSHYKGKHIHFLGYNFDVHNKKIKSTFKNLQKKHIIQIKKTIKILKNNGWKIKNTDILDNKSAYIGSVHLAEALKNNRDNWERIKQDFGWTKGMIIPITEIINKYLFQEYGRIYKEAEIPVRQAIKLIKTAGGTIVLAHPGQHFFWHEDDIVLELKSMGLDGIEAISSHHSWAEMEHWQKFAKQNKLIITIGSDFHGHVPKEWGFVVNSPWDYFKITNHPDFTKIF
ncbi:PHP domain-containing protein [Patescibacteria group bacterium]|nr:PHP domain-containing protein [Patescibacteria group bacterium]